MLSDQRYYATGAGRFMTADPYKASAGASDPGSWNRNAYVGGDPVNLFDPAGLAACRAVSSYTETDSEFYTTTRTRFEIHCTGRYLLLFTNDYVSENSDQRTAAHAMEMSVGTAAYREGSSFSRYEAYYRAARTQSVLSLHALDSDKCRSTLAALGVTAGQVRRRVDSLRVFDASQADLQVQAATGHTVNNVETGRPDSSLTVAQHFDANTAVTGLAGVLVNTLYIDTQSWTQKGDTTALGAMLHETFHFLGVNDTQLGNVLFGAPTADKELYSLELRQRCFF